VGGTGDGRGGSGPARVHGGRGGRVGRRNGGGSGLRRLHRSILREAG
jgi:hypothetical protein